MIEISLLEKLNSSNYRWWDVSDRIKNLLVENGCIQVNNKVVKDLLVTSFERSNERHTQRSMYLTPAE